MFSKEQISNAFKAAKDCDVATKVLTSLFGTPKRDFSDYHDIKTLEDAIEATGMTLPTEALETLPKDVVAFMKLRIVAAALNGLQEDELDKFPTFSTDEYRYYPYFVLYTEEGIKDMDEDKRKELVLWGGAAYHGAYCGLAFAYSYSDWSNSYAAFGSRLAVKSADIARYFGKQFIELWKDFCIGKD